MSLRRLLGGGMAAWAICLPGSVCAQEPLEPGTTSYHPLHRFDFDERDLGNLEEVPMFWTAFRSDGFPRFAEGRFDWDVGRSERPSFHLASEGRSVAYRYSGSQTRLHASSDYRVEGFIRTDRLVYARACLSAHYVDKQGYPIPGTLVRSRFVGGPDEQEGWTRVECYLPAAPARALTIGLQAWVLQRSQWDTVTPLRRHIVRRDVRGGAWFDDISIYALPRVELTTGSPGNVLTPEGPHELQITILDPNDTTLDGRLEVRAVDGHVVMTETIAAVVGDDTGPTRFPVDHLSPGLYHARLDVPASGGPVISRQLTFARLAPLLREQGSLARPFGVVIDPRRRNAADTELAFLMHQAVRSVKLPVWTGLTEEAPTASQRRAEDRLLQDLARSSFALTGVFFGPPAKIVRADGAFPRPLLELLTESPAVWREHLAAAVAPYASLFHWWQMGPDQSDIIASPEEQALAIRQLREAMALFVTVPLLAVPASAAVEPPAETLPAEQLSVSLGRELTVDWFAPQIERLAQLGYDRLSVYLEPLPPDRYRSDARLADWAQRVISARHAGADTVFVPQTWRTRERPWGDVTEPTDEYLILRTIADVIAGATPGQRVRAAPGVRCLAFHEGETTILALWDPKAPPEGNRHVIQLGQAQRSIDLWGNTRPLERAEDGRQIIRLSPVPVLVDGVERWLIDFRTSVTLTPDHVETGVESVEHALAMVQQRSLSISGRAQLDVPDDLYATPRAFEFSLVPNRTKTIPLTIRYPHNASAGTMDLVARITLTAPAYHLEIPLTVDLGLSDLEVQGTAAVEGSDLVLRHAITNRSADILNFRGSASVPGRERQYRPFSDLRPGDTQTVEYRFSGAAGLFEATVRLGLYELNDGPRRHNLTLRVP